MSEERKWYVVHTYSGYENKVKANLERRVASMNMEHSIFTVVVPTEEVVEYKAGKKKAIQKKLFPGYVLVEMAVTDDSWYVVRNTPGVTGFVGSGVKPTPLEDHEIQILLRNMSEEKSQTELDFILGDTVLVVSGPFVNFAGKIEHIDMEQSKLRVCVSMFGRETPVELEFHQVKKET